jgi:lysophospholipase L1-like esterase
LRVRALISLLSIVLPALANAVPLSLAAFGDSITCDTCNDGSYLGLLENYLPEAPIIDENTVSGGTSGSVYGLVDSWITGGNTADVVIILTGTPDTYLAVGGYGNRPYSEAETVANIDAMLDLVILAGLPAILVAPPPVLAPCGNPAVLACSEIDARLESLADALAILASSLSVPFVDLYGVFVNDPGYLETPGDTDSLFLADGLHPKIDTGDDLTALVIASAITGNVIPEPSTAPLLAFGLAVLAVRRRRLR